MPGKLLPAIDPCTCQIILLDNIKGAFRTQSNIYNETFLRKQLKGKTCQLFLQKIFIIDVRQDSKCASEYCFGYR